MIGGRAPWPPGYTTVLLSLLRINTSDVTQLLTAAEVSFGALLRDKWKRLAITQRLRVTKGLNQNTVGWNVLVSFTGDMQNASEHRPIISVIARLATDQIFAAVQFSLNTQRTICFRLNYRPVSVANGNVRHKPTNQNNDEQLNYCEWVSA